MGGGTPQRAALFSPSQDFERRPSEVFARVTQGHDFHFQNSQVVTSLYTEGESVENGSESKSQNSWKYIFS